MPNRGKPSRALRACRSPAGRLSGQARPRPTHLILTSPPNHPRTIRKAASAGRGLTAYNRARSILRQPTTCTFCRWRRPAVVVKELRVPPYEAIWTAIAHFSEGEEMPCKIPRKEREKAAALYIPMTRSRSSAPSSPLRPRATRRRDAASSPQGSPDPALYEDCRGGELATWQAKYPSEWTASDRAERLWVAVAEKLERAEAG